MRRFRISFTISVPDDRIKDLAEDGGSPSVEEVLEWSEIDPGDLRRSLGADAGSLSMEVIP